jgi:hypothetical protein
MPVSTALFPPPHPTLWLHPVLSHTLAPPPSALPLLYTPPMRWLSMGTALFGCAYRRRNTKSTLMDAVYGAGAGAGSGKDAEGGADDSSDEDDFFKVSGAATRKGPAGPLLPGETYVSATLLSV